MSVCRTTRAVVAASMATALLAATLPVTPAVGQLYRWTDAQGVVHYTGELGSVPAAYRSRVDTVKTPQPRPAVSTPAPPGDAGVLPRDAAGRLVVGARLNGAPLSLLVDTGADRTVISPSAMARAGFGAERGTAVNVVGVAGSASARLVTLPTLDVGGVRIGPLAVIVHALPTEGVDGLLGRDILDRFTLVLEGGSGAAVLTPGTSRGGGPRR